LAGRDRGRTEASRTHSCPPSWLELVRARELAEVGPRGGLGVSSPAR
jgi:hypothetical protein